MVSGGLLIEDRQACFQFWGLNLDDDPTTQPRPQAQVEGCDVLRRCRACDDDLLAAVRQAIQDMQERLLRVTLASDVLYVVHEQDIRLLVLIAQRLDVPVL